MGSDLGAFEGLAPALKRLIAKSGRTQQEIAERTGVARPTVSRIANGRDKPSIETLGRLLSDGLGMNALDLAEALLEVNRSSDLVDVVPRSELEAALRVLHLRLRVGGPTSNPPARTKKSSKR